MKQGGSATATIMPESAVATAVGLSILDTPAPAAHKEEVETKLDTMRDQLLTLRRQQEELERQKGDLEELRRKQDEYTRGKAEMIDNLTRALIVLEREQIQAQRLAELCENTGTAFKDYLEQLQAINDAQWTSATVRPELSRALGIIENSRLEFNRGRTKLECLDPSAKQPETEPVKPGIDWAEILRFARLGAAASAPLIIAGTIWVVLLIAIKH
jgi:hypothetical protein